MAEQVAGLNTGDRTLVGSHKQASSLRLSVVAMSSPRAEHRRDGNRTEAYAIGNIAAEADHFYP